WEENIFYQKHSFLNYEIQLNTEMGKGIKNVFNLLLYQIIVFLHLFKNRKKIDIIHAFDLDAGLPTVLIKLMLNKKVVYHIADFYVDSRTGIPNILKKYVKKLEYYIISKSEVTIICIEERKNQIKNSNPNKLYVIHNSPVESMSLKRDSYRKSK